MTLVEDIVVRKLGRADYLPTWQAMREFTRGRQESTPDELWLVEHPPVYTVGQGASVPSLVSTIPVVKTDRGGDITYHGPGQVVLYALVDLVRRSIKVKRFVWLLEQAVIDLIGRDAERKAGAPGVYVDGAKIAALGIRVVRGRAYHGVALNVDMDLSPFNAIDPCGYPGLRVTQMRDLGLAATADQLAQSVIKLLDA
ncbi:MAG TPA: lipoyl(octanoyl) transferase LipB [Burkholderiales bacterium]|jgi:lipoyl(octanoyl) transferase|nr:lipoyl(octanoyl) transferase LipB [Burkholderiales bacterium]